MLIRRLANSRGDTIVEVLIAVAIVSLTLTGAYASVNRSTNATRTAQERAEALKWAETQVEQIKADPAATLPNSAFCYNTDLSRSPTAPCVKTNGVQYSATINQILPLNSGNFQVVVTWPGLNSTTNQVELDYKK